MDYLDRAVEGIKKLIPPPDGASDSHLYRWRLWIAGATFLNALGLTLHIALACGFAAPFYTGFAKASQFDEVKQQMTAVQADLDKKRIKELANLILDTKHKHCLATGEARRLYLDSLNALRDEYYDKTHRVAPDPPCSDFQ
jgi:hypothetical protein